MNEDHVELKGRLYKLRLIDFGPEWGTYYLASMQLEKLLWDTDHGYTSDEAQSVDELIFYFIPIHYFKLSDDELQKKHSEVL
jgi:hypothetical protein